jgi:PAS domain S-box-containing protein
MLLARPLSANNALARGAHRLAWLLLALSLAAAVLGTAAISLLSAARAYVGGEGIWSRAQKSAVQALLLYLDDGNEAHFRDWEAAIAVPMGDRRAREELDQPAPDLQRVTEGFTAGQNHPDDIPAMIRLYRCCSSLPFMAASVRAWQEADALLAELSDVAPRARALHARGGNAEQRMALRAQVLALDARVVPLEVRFSAELGEAARLADQVLTGTLIVTSLVVGLGGYTLVRRRTRREHVAARALARSEALFRSLWQTTDDTVLIVGADNLIRFANPAADSLFGHPAGTLVGQALSVVIPERMRAGHQAGMTRHMADGSRKLDWSGARVPARRADGSEVPVEIRFARFDTEGETLFVGFLRDITERQRAEREILDANSSLEQRVAERTHELVQANSRLLELDRLKSDFLASMSHELRTPLNSILGFATVLHQGMAGPLTAEQQRQLGYIKGSGQHLLALINDLLDLSRIESGRMEIAHEPFDLREVAAEVHAHLRPLAERKGLALRLSAPESLPLLGDRRKTYQVLLNVAGNAVKFTEHGHVEIHATRQDGQARIDVRDSGIGIAPGQLQQIFEAFRQVDTGLARSHDGTGLGLHLTQHLLALMGGSIEVESRPGQGSLFRVRLPLRGPAASAPTPATRHGAVV